VNACGCGWSAPMSSAASSIFSTSGCKPATRTTQRGSTKRGRWGRRLGFHR
jgi:hypothetical protein